jgi:hypothetical protein
MRSLIASLLFIVPASLLTARDTDDWVEFKPKNGNLTIKMPAKPKDQKPQDITYPGGKSKLYMYILEVEGGKGAYMVAYNDFPADLITDEVAEAALDGAQKGAVTNVKGKLIGTPKKITLQKKYPGRDFTFEVAGIGQARARVYLVEGRLYQTAVFGSEELIKSAETKVFLDSFKVTVKE